MSRRLCPSCGGVVEARQEANGLCPHCGAAVVGRTPGGAPSDPCATVPAVRGRDEDEATAPYLEMLPTDGPTLSQARPGTVMPARFNVSLAIVGGPRSGEVVRLERSAVVIGRAGADSGADLEIDDPALSRSHATLEVLGGLVVLRDLGSRNGTFVDQKRVEAATLEDRAEFRLGGTTFMLILTPRDET